MAAHPPRSVAISVRSAGMAAHPRRSVAISVRSAGVVAHPPRSVAISVRSAGMVAHPPRSVAISVRSAGMAAHPRRAVAISVRSAGVVAHPPRSVAISVRSAGMAAHPRRAVAISVRSAGVVTKDLDAAPLAWNNGGMLDLVDLSGAAATLGFVVQRGETHHFRQADRPDAVLPVRVTRRLWADLGGSDLDPAPAGVAAMLRAAHGCALAETVRGTSWRATFRVARHHLWLILGHRGIDGFVIGHGAGDLW
jgi:hypothetical protein